MEDSPRHFQPLRNPLGPTGEGDPRANPSSTAPSTNGRRFIFIITAPSPAVSPGQGLAFPPRRDYQPTNRGVENYWWWFFFRIFRPFCSSISISRSRFLERVCERRGKFRENEMNIGHCSSFETIFLFKYWESLLFVSVVDFQNQTY